MYHHGIDNFIHINNSIFYANLIIINILKLNKIHLPIGEIKPNFLLDTAVEIKIKKKMLTTIDKLIFLLSEAIIPVN